MLAHRPFRYGTLLRVRRRQLDVRAAALAAVRRGIHVATAQRHELLAQQRRALSRADEETRATFDAQDIQRYFQFERYLARLADEKDASIAALRTDESERRQELEDARKRLRIVERLQERHQAARRTELNRQEQRLSDEAATNQAAISRKRRQGP